MLRNTYSGKYTFPEIRISLNTPNTEIPGLLNTPSSEIGVPRKTGYSETYLFGHPSKPIPDPMNPTLERLALAIRLGTIALRSEMFVPTLAVTATGPTAEPLSRSLRDHLPSNCHAGSTELEQQTYPTPNFAGHALQKPAPA